MTITRRSLIGSLAASSAASMLGSCASGLTALPGIPSGKLVDVHCHVFNATDLPAARFIRYAVMGNYPRPKGVGVLDIEDPDVVDALIALFVFLVAGAAPSADDELAVLDGRAQPVVWAASSGGAANLMVSRLAAYLAADQSGLPSDKALGLAGGRGKVKSAILDAGRGIGTLRGERSLASGELNAIARRAYLSPSDIGQYLRFFGLFVRYRYSLVDQLVEIQRNQGFAVTLLAPAMIDFSTWLGESVKSSLQSQVKVMGAISRRRVGPPVHGYVAYDPLREVYFRRRLVNTPSALSVVRSALTDHGFIGVKLYPPMGFRPSGNSASLSYPPKVSARVGSSLSEDLNVALATLYDVCVELGAPVLAHAAESNGAGPGFDQRADPAYWLQVFRKWPTLHVCLAHFGRFSYKSAASPHGAALPESSWEWAIGRAIRDRPTAPIFADLSYFSEVLNGSRAEKAYIATSFIKYVNQCDPDVKHLLFGTDWVMLGQEKGNEEYTRGVVSFLRDECHLTDAQLNNVLVENAKRFLGLERGSVTLKRLKAFYKEIGMPADRLELNV